MSRIHGTLVSLGTRRLATTRGEFVAHVFQSLATRDYALAVACGDLASPAPLLARVHSSCVTSESWGGCDCDCAQQLDAALARIGRAGRGVVFYLMQEGRGAGFLAKARDRMIVQASGNRLSTFEAYAQMGLPPDCRRYDEVVLARELLGIAAPFELLTNNPAKTSALEAAGIPIAGIQPLRHAASPFNVHYLRAKLQLGHTLAADAGDAGAALPEPVPTVEPRALPGAPQVVHVASYLLPVVLRDGGPDSGPHWFWSHAYLDAAARRSRVVLAYGRAGGDVLAVRVQPEALTERFPLPGGGTHRRLWNATVRAFVTHGAGAAVFTVRDELGGDARPSDAGSNETALLLLAHHAGGRRVRPVVAAGDEAAESALRAGLARLGVAAGESIVLAGDA